MQQARDIIQNDTELERIDKNYKGNAYFEFAGKTRSEMTFSFPALEKVLWTIKEGELSDVIRIPQENLPGKVYDEQFYVIIKVDKRENAGVGSYEEFIKNEIKNYEIILY